MSLRGRMPHVSDGFDFSSRPSTSDTPLPHPFGEHVCRRLGLTSPTVAIFKQQVKLLYVAQQTFTLLRRSLCAYVNERGPVAAASAQQLDAAIHAAILSLT